jgi:hypothetical protein
MDQWIREDIYIFNPSHFPKIKRERSETEDEIIGGQCTCSYFSVHTCMTGLGKAP